MKAVMYHYVRPDGRGWPHHPYLSLADFRAQLDHFAANGGFVSRDEFDVSVRDGDPVPRDKHVLTFDDGLSDHVEFVIPELERRGLWGIFYVPTGPYAVRRLLAVHRVHALIGKIGAEQVLESLAGAIREDMLLDTYRSEFRSLTYLSQTASVATKLIKRIFNYYLPYEVADTLLDGLMQQVFDDEAALFERFYVPEGDLRCLSRRGMLVGSHSVSHRVLSRLSADQQGREICDSFSFLRARVGEQDTKTFCYPYGGFHSFTAETMQLLTANGVSFSFNVEDRSIESRDIRDSPQALPRFDCNQFAHGAPSYGRAAYR